MKILIVGGGITGCVTALRLAEKGHEVCLHERSSKLGGSLLDLVDEKGFWFRACQYLTPDASWYKEVIPQLDCQMLTFPHRYASWTKFSGTTTYRDDLALPSLEASVPKSLPNSYTAETLLDRFNNYESKISKFLVANAERCGHSTNELDEQCAISIQLSKVYLKEDEQKVLKLKKQNHIADNLYALPRRVFGNEFETLNASIPKEGYECFFQALNKLLNMKGIEINLNSGITARSTPHDRQKFSAFYQKEKFDVDLTIWCCNPVPLLIAAGMERLDSPAVKFIHIHCKLENIHNLHPIYMQCFDPESPIYRLYIYPTSSGPQLCIECFSNPKQKETEILFTAKLLLSKMFKNVEISPVHTEFYLAHFLYTLRDSIRLREFNNISKANNFVSGAWEVFGRDKKINLISERVNEFSQISQT